MCHFFQPFLYVARCLPNPQETIHLIYKVDGSGVPETVVVWPAVRPTSAKVLYASDHPCAGAPECSLPQQCSHWPVVWRDGIVPGRGLRPMLALLPMPALGHCLRKLSHLVPCMDHPVCLLGSRESVGTLPVWAVIVLGATLLGNRIAEVSFAGRALMH